MIDPDLRSRRGATVRAHRDAENRHNVPATIATFAHPQYEVVPGEQFFDGAAEVLPHAKKITPKGEWKPIV